MQTYACTKQQVACRFRIFATVLPGELKPTLEELRRVRAGVLQPRDVRGPLANYLGHGLGHLCDLLAAWIENDEGDRRGVDATLRFYGLSRMPEALTSIAPSLRTEWEQRGLTTRRVEQLIDECIQRAELRKPPFRIPSTSLSEGFFVDPCPLPLSSRAERDLRRSILWAWADATDPPSTDAIALLLYEFEHGLRIRGPDLGDDRKRRLRLRRRAWAMVEVALYRRGEAYPSDWLVNRSLGPRFDSDMEILPLAGGEALVVAIMNPAVADLRAALAYVRSSVREQRPEARELLGLLRDVIRRTRNVPADVTSKLLALTAIDARVNRDPAGLVAAEQAIAHALNLSDTAFPQRDPAYSTVVLDALRAGHEGAQLAFSVGDYVASTRIFRRTSSLLRLVGDPEPEIEPRGWEQQFSLFEASLLRTSAKYSPNAEKVLDRAVESATISMSLVFEEGALPPRWGLNARSQRVGALVDQAEMAARTGDVSRSKVMAKLAGRELSELVSEWRAIGSGSDGGEGLEQTRSGLLSAARHAWRLAIVKADPERIVEQRSQVLEMTRKSVSGFAADKFRQLDEASRRVTDRITEDDEVVSPLVRDRGNLWAL